MLGGNQEDKSKILQIQPVISNENPIIEKVSCF